MSLQQLDLLADVQTLLEDMRRWAESDRGWPPARTAAAIVRQLNERAESLRVRLEAPLVVATLGGTGTGKSTLINALAGADVVRSGRQRPTTLQPTLICSPRITPEMLGIDPDSVELVQRELPALGELVLVDCPDPDTSELAGDEELAATNLGRLRALLPHCDVLLVTSSQQKYRSARVLDELRSAAAGAKLIFVQTHADTDSDIRDDWRAVLGEQYAVGDMFFVDSLAALADAQSGLAPRGEFGRLVELLRGALSRTAAKRIRRSNFLELVTEALEACRLRIDAGMPAIDALERALAEQRAKLAARLVDQTRDELLANRRLWEDRLLGEVASRWGFSPFAVVLRLYQGLGNLISGAALWRVRTPVQMALWGAATGTRSLQRFRDRRQAEAGTDRAIATAWDPGQLRTAAIIIDGYAAEAGCARVSPSSDALQNEAAAAGASFVQTTAAQLQALVAKLAARHARLSVRIWYELLLGALLAFLLFRAGKNFFYDSWLAPVQTQVFGTDFFLHAAFWLVAWCGLLLALFTVRLRGGLRREIVALCEAWRTSAPAPALFTKMDDYCREAHLLRRELEQLEQRATTLAAHLNDPETARLGHRTTIGL